MVSRLTPQYSAPSATVNQFLIVPSARARLFETGLNSFVGLSR